MTEQPAALPETLASPAPAAPPEVEARPAAASAPLARPAALPRLLLAVAVLASLLALGLASKTWSNAQQLQKQVAKQVADMHLQTRESNTVARLANDQSRDANTKSALLEGKVSELQIQRAQLDSVLQTLTRAKDETLLADVDAAIQLGQQQSQLTGSAQPVLAALLGAEKRLSGSNQPQWQPLHQAVQRDIDRLKRIQVSDVPVLLGKIDQIMRQIDTLPLTVNVVPALGGHARNPPATAASQPQPAAPRWQAMLHALGDSLLGMVRVRDIDSKDVALLQPEQGYYLRQNLKLRLLNARMALLARQPQLGKSDIASVKDDIGKYFDARSALVKTSMATLDDVLEQTHTAELPAITDTQNALTAARNAAAAAQH